MLKNLVKLGIGALAAATIATTVTSAAKAGQGITDDKIILGSHQPLSGPVALWGIPVSNGMRMAVEEVNAKGGINGRMVELIVEDTAYSQAKAAQAGDKLLKKDKVFALVGPLGTPTNMVTMPRALKMGVMNLFPFTAATEMYEPYHKLKFSNFTPYADQMRAAVNYFNKNMGIKRIGAMYQDDDFGKNVLAGCVDQAKALGLPELVKTSFKRGSKDFSSQISKLKAAKVELVCMGTIIGETIGGMATARKLGFNPAFVVTSAGYVPENVTLAKGLTEGLYGTGQSQIQYYEDATPAVKAWMDAYKARFNKGAVIQAMASYDIMQMALDAIKMAGKDVTAEKVAAALETIKNRTTIFGGAPVSFSKDDHLGPDARTGAALNQVRGKKWVKISDISY